MKLDVTQKTNKDVVARLWEITTESFFGVERPPRGVFNHTLESGDIYVNDDVDLCRHWLEQSRCSWCPIYCYALVISKFGEPYIQSIATAPEHRGRGLAGRLIDEISREAIEAKAGGIGLTVNVNNTAAQRLYLDFGFRVERVLRGYYGDDNGLFMRRKLC